VAVSVFLRGSQTGARLPAGGGGAGGPLGEVRVVCMRDIFFSTKYGRKIIFLVGSCLVEIFYLSFITGSPTGFEIKAAHFVAN
jgi:hypothetical protein